MIKKRVLFVAILTIAHVMATETTTTFGVQSAPQSDEYGNSVYQRDVTIQTTDFKVDNFWSKFSNPNNKQSNHTNIAKTGTLNIKVEATSACTLDGTLPQEGCSGQKPFLINNEVLDNSIGGDEFEVAFTLADGFNATDMQGFYPLDILRDEQYYKEPLVQENGSKRSFFSFFTGIFDFMFSKTIGFGSDFFGNADIADVQYDPRSDDAVDRRQRYIANIIAGVEKKHRITKPFESVSATQIDASTKLNNPASLLHYDEAKQTTEQEQCKFMFLNLSNDGLMCRVMTGFGMDAWMPFFSNSHTTKVEVNTIMGDTENALLAMTAEIEKVPYMEDVGGSDNDKLSFLQNMLKPMTTMINFMKTMLFGTSKQSSVAEPVERVYEFSEADAMTLSMAITNDGTQIDDFANFKLLKIRSVYGDMINSCKVKKSFAMFSPGWTKTFVEGGTQSVKSPDGDWWNDDQWITWCQEATSKKGIFDALFDWSSGGIFNPINWMSSFFNVFLSFFSSTYSIEDFKSTIKRGLILNIKKVELDPLSQRNGQIIEIVKIK